jgi:ferredoxin-NADP reductase
LISLWEAAKMSQRELTMPSGSAAAKAWNWLAQSLTQHDKISAYFEPLIQIALPQWTTEGYRSKVVQVRKETADVYTLVITPSSRWSGFIPGQYLEITAERDGALQSRYFSISCSPEQYSRSGNIELTIRVQEGGRITPWLREHFEHGGVVRLSAAQGDFVLPVGDDPVLMIAGGSGITPFRSMLQHLGACRSDRDVHLLYYGRDAQSLLFRDEFERLAAEHSNIRITFMNGEEVGVISQEHIREHCADFAERFVMICGPTPMIKRSRSLLQEMGVAEDRIAFEYFGAAPIEMERESADDALVSFERSGLFTEVSAKEPTSLLDVAESQGLKPVSGCRIGVCHQCKCTKKSGVVYNTKTGAYSDTGHEDIQLCISVAVNDVVLDI